jgi:hypothetical protein
MMTEAVIHIKIKAPYIEQMLAKINNFLLSDSDKLEITVESPPFDPTFKLTYEELFALPEDQQMAYFKAHGGVFAVMHEMGYGLTQEDIDDWHKMQEEEDKEWALEYKRRYGKDLPR